MRRTLVSVRAAVAVGAIFLGTSAASAAQLANYPFTGGSAASTDSDANTTAANVALTATGSSISTTSDNLFFRSNSTASAATVAEAISKNSYVAFTITPGSGASMSFDTLTFASGGSNSDTDAAFSSTVFVKSSVGGFAETDPTLGTFTKNIPTGNGGAGILDARSIDLAGLGATFQNLTAPVTFRFYFVDDADSTNKINRLDTVVLNGTSVVPEPAGAAVAGLAAMGLLLRRRRN